MDEPLVQIANVRGAAGGLGRRDFLKATALATAAGSLAACHNPENILPLLVPDPRQEAGRPQFFASVCRECPAGCGLVVRVNDGRPTKCEGNPDHPVNRGKLCLRGQTAVQGLYNPDRFKAPRLRGPHGVWREVSWEVALARLEEELAQVRAEGAGGRIQWLGRLETGTLDQTIRAWLARQGAPAPMYYEYFSYDALREAMAISYGQAVVPSYHINDARYLLSFGAEFLETWVSNVEYAGDFAATHSYGHTKTPARFVAVGPRLSLTAANADEWWAARPGTENQIAWLLVALVAQRRGLAPRLPAAYRLPALTLAQVAAASGVAANVLTLAAERLVAADLSLVVGPGYQTDNRQAVDCQVAVNALNDLLGNTGRTVDPTRPHALSAVTRQADVLELFRQAQDTAPGTATRLLLLHHANPAYHHPAVMSGLAKIPFKVSFSPWMDETTQFSDLILPDLDPLECWGDYSPQPAITGILQPCRVPLYPNRQTADVLLGGQGRFHQTLEAQWTARVGGTPAWNALLQKGVTSSAAVPSASQPHFPLPTPDAAPPPASHSPLPTPHFPLPAPSAAPPPASHSPLPTPHFPAAATTGEAATFAGTGELYLVLFPSVQFFDGRQANRSWAQEIAEPLSKLAWDGWCELHPATAERLGLKANDIVRLHSPYGTAEFSLFITTWIRPDAVGVLMGQGHSNFGMWASERGENVHQLQQAWPELGQWHAQTVKVSLEKTGKQRALANLQAEKLQFDKQLALATSLDLADLAQEPPPGPSFYHFHHPYLHHRWGMAIDLDSCIGCNACQAACYAENNIAVWGRSSLLSHREMTWIRVELYEGSQRNPSTQLSPDLRFLPIPCQQCGNAPCEYVCPVFAAYHTDEGLNGQVYNRCVGTRYCSNNCIYKVRRFNWYTPQWPSPLDQQLNPAVTVRAKGIMEKCSFCVQRIEQVELDARTNKTGIPDGAIQTACMQTCPTDAIVFGDLLDPLSRVARLSADPRGYGLMADENTYPAVTYLRKVNFDLNAGPSYEGHGGVG